MDGAEATYGIQLSDNMELTHEGYLRCFNAVIARTGVQTYRFHQLPQEEAAELGITGAPDDFVDLHRDAEDVFDPVFMASLEDKDVTFLHPDKLLTLDTVLNHSVGHMRDVRPGEEPLEDGNMPLLATIVIKSKALIDRILAGLRQLSLGYTFHIAKDGERILQVEMTGNHTAVLPIGRAGNAEIQDSADVPREPIVKLEDMTIKQRIAYLFGLGLKNLAASEHGTPENLSAAATAMDGVASARAATARTPVTPIRRGAAARDAGERRRPAARRNSAAQDERDAAHALIDQVYDENDAATEEEIAAREEAREELQALLGGEATDGDEAREAEDGEDHEREAADEDDSEDEDEDEGEAEDAGEGSGEVIPVGDRAKPAAPGLDGKGKRAKDGKGRSGMDGMDVLKRLRPVIARTKDKAVRAAFDSAYHEARGRESGRGVRGVRAQGAGYDGFARAAAAVAADAGTPEDSLSTKQTAAYALAKTAKRNAYK
jgi:hypothetical protein